MDHAALVAARPSPPMILCARGAVFVTVSPTSVKSEHAATNKYTSREGRRPNLGNIWRRV